MPNEDVAHTDITKLVGGICTMLRHCPVHIVGLRFNINEQIIIALEKERIVALPFQNNLLLGEESITRHILTRGNPRTTQYIGLFDCQQHIVAYDYPWDWLKPVDRRPNGCAQALEKVACGSQVYCNVNGLGIVKSVKENNTLRIEFVNAYNFDAEMNQSENRQTYEYTNGINRHIFGAGVSLFSVDYLGHSACAYSC